MILAMERKENKLIIFEMSLSGTHNTNILYFFSLFINEYF